MNRDTKELLKEASKIYKEAQVPNEKDCILVLPMSVFKRIPKSVLRYIAKKGD